MILFLILKDALANNFLYTCDFNQNSLLNNENFTKFENFSNLSHILPIYTFEEDSIFFYSKSFNNSLHFSHMPIIVQFQVQIPLNAPCSQYTISLWAKNKKQNLIQHEIENIKINQTEDNFTLNNNESQTNNDFCESTISSYALSFGPLVCNNYRYVIIEIFAENKIHRPLFNVPIPKDELPHLYTLIIFQNSTYSILIDNENEQTNSLHSFYPPFLRPETVPDMDAQKPDNWDDNPFIISDFQESDEENGLYQYAKQTDSQKLFWHYNTSHFIPDPSSQQPKNWDEEILGPWEPPLIPNPECSFSIGCGNFEPFITTKNNENQIKKIPNPKYRGHWERPLIPNP